MSTKPFAYQEDAVRKIEFFDGRALLAMDMGLGKSFTALKWRFDYLPANAVTVIVCPAGVKYVWESQCAEHFNVRAEVLSGRNPRPFTITKPKTVVINYDILGRVTTDNTWLRELKRLRPKLVIIDECHYCKDRRTIRYKAVRELCKGVPHVLALSGTPATNCPAEFWPTLNIIRPDKFNSFWTFAHRFCGPRRVPWSTGWEFKGSTNPAVLNRLLRKTLMIRHTKQEVLKDLPAKTRTVIPVDIENRKEYESAERDLIRWLIKQRKRGQAARAANAEKLVRVGYLRRLAANLKMKSVVEWIETFLRERPNDKLLVYGVHKSVLKPLHDKWRGVSVLVNGEVTGRKRQNCIDRFNNHPECRLFFGNVDAAGVGWSCKSATDVLFVELPFVPGKLTQAEDRCHGVGRGIVGRKLNIWFIVAHNTVETKLVTILTEKQKNLGRVLDGKKAVKLDVLEKLEESLIGRRAA